MLAATINSGPDVVPESPQLLQSLLQLANDSPFEQVFQSAMSMLAVMLQPSVVPLAVSHNGSAWYRRTKSLQWNRTSGD